MLFLFLGITLVFSPPVWSLTVTQNTRLVLEVRQNRDQFGWQTRLSYGGRWAFVGSYGFDGISGRTDQGAAWMYRGLSLGSSTMWYPNIPFEVAGTGELWPDSPVTWQFQPSDGEANDWYGYAVDVFKLYGAVGSPSQNISGTGSGEVYLYKWSYPEWSPHAVLTPPAGSTGHEFGTSVAMSRRQVMVVGATDYSAPSPRGPGAAYVYNYEPPNGAPPELVQVLTPSDGQSNDQFGTFVATDGETIVVGALYGDGNEPTSGAAYVYSWDGTSWGNEQKLIASDGKTDDWFGWSVGVSGRHIVVGAPKEDGATNNVAGNSGAVYFFRRNNQGIWIQQMKATPLNLEAADNFGYSVAIEGNLALFGAPASDHVGCSSSPPGSAYLYLLSLDGGAPWSLANEVMPSSLTSFDARFGSSVDLLDDTLIVGSPYDERDQCTEPFTVYGAAYIFDVTGTACELGGPVNLNLDCIQGFINLDGVTIALWDGNQDGLMEAFACNGDDLRPINPGETIIDCGLRFVNGTVGDDFVDFSGNATPTIFAGGPGNDTISGSQLDDLLLGGSGSDSLQGGHGNDVIGCGLGNDSCDGGLGDDRIYGNDGDDLLYGQAGMDEIHGGAGMDTVFGNDDDDVVTAGGGNDTVYGGNGSDLLFCDDGNDFCYGNAGQDTVKGGAGIDTCDGGADTDYIDCGAGTDQIFGLAGNDEIVACDRTADIIDAGLGTNWCKVDCGVDSTTSCSRVVCCE